MAKKQKDQDGVWSRFERAIDIVAKSPPKHKPAKKPKKKAAKKR
jgi:hypothetical protein